MGLSPRHTAHSRARARARVRHLSFSFFLSPSRGPRAGSRLANRTDDRVYLVKVMCTVSFAVVNKMYAGAERASARARALACRMAATPIYTRYALRDCKYEPNRALVRARACARVCVRARGASCLSRCTYEPRRRRRRHTAQWRNYRVNGRTDAAMRKNLAGIRSPGV